MKVIYVAGRYTAETHSGISDNIVKAEKLSIELWKRGWAVITPHLNTAHFEKYEDENINYNTWVHAYIEILKRCDAIIMMRGWEESRGAIKEHEFADTIGMDIYYESDEVPGAGI